MKEMRHDDVQIYLRLFSIGKVIYVKSFILNRVCAPFLPTLLLLGIDDAVAAPGDNADRNKKSLWRKFVGFVSLQVRAQWPFEQTPNLLIIGYLCRKCAEPFPNRTNKLILAKVMKKLRARNGDRDA